MLSKLSAVVLAVAPFATAIICSTPTGVVHVGDRVAITWQTQAGDPSSISVWLHHPTFNSDFALANNADVGQGQVTVEIPQVAAQDDYTIRLTPISNVTDTLSASNDFAISTATSTVTQTSVPSSASSSSSVAANTTVTSNATATTGVTTPTTPFGTTLSSTDSTALSTGSSSDTSSSPASSNTGSSGSFNAGSSIKANLNAVGVVALLAGLVAVGL